MTKKSILPDGVTSNVSEDKDQATITVTVSAPYSLLETHYDQSFKDLSKSLKADGFRPGKIPAEIAAKQIPDIMVLDRAGRQVIGDLYLPLLQTHKVDGIGEPSVQITKLAKNNPFEFSITLAKMPEVDLGDYAKIRDNADNAPIDPTVTDDELDQATHALRQQWARQDTYQKLVESDPESAKTTDPRQIQVTDDELPELTLEWVKQLGNYESIDDFKTAFRTNIKTNKAMQELDTRRSQILGQIAESADFSVPELVYQAELDRMVEQRKAEIKQAGLKFNDYLKAINKSEDDMRVDMMTDAKNRVHTQMVIAKIAVSENLKIDNDLVAKEVEYLQKLYPEANQANLVAYVESQLTSNEVLRWLVAPIENEPEETDNKKAKDKESVDKDSADK